jgi:hypothetical protein
MEISQYNSFVQLIYMKKNILKLHAKNVYCSYIMAKMLKAKSPMVKESEST